MYCVVNIHQNDLHYEKRSEKHGNTSGLMFNVTRSVSVPLCLQCNQKMY